MAVFLLGVCLGLLPLRVYMDYRNAPYCRHCDWRHKGRCIFMPRSEEG